MNQPAKQPAAVRERLTQVRRKDGTLVGYLAPLGTLAGESLNSAWIFCLWCGTQFGGRKHAPVMELARHRTSNVCGKGKALRILAETLRLPSRTRISPDDDNFRHRTEPLTLAFGEEWPRRFWGADPDQIRYEIRRANEAAASLRPEGP